MQAPDHSFTAMASSPRPFSQGKCIYESLGTCRLLLSHPALGCSSPSSLVGAGVSPLHYAPWPCLTLRSKIKSLRALHWFPQPHPSLGWASAQASASSSSQVCTPKPVLRPAMLCSAYGLRTPSFSLSEHRSEHSPSVCQVGTTRRAPHSRD